MKASRDHLKILMSFDSLITGDELFHVKDLCIHSKSKDGSSSVVPSSRKLHDTLKCKKNSLTYSKHWSVQTLVQHN